MDLRQRDDLPRSRPACAIGSGRGSSSSSALSYMPLEAETEIIRDERPGSCCPRRLVRSDDRQRRRDVALLKRVPITSDETFNPGIPRRVAAVRDVAEAVAEHDGCATLRQQHHSRTDLADEVEARRGRGNSAFWPTSVPCRPRRRTAARVDGSKKRRRRSSDRR